MGKSNAVSKRRRKNKNPKFVSNNKLKKRRNKLMAKEITIECETIRKSWDQKKNMKTNLQSIGLSLNPNKSIAINGQKTTINGQKTSKETKSINKSKVIEDLETIADKPNDKQFRFGPQVTKFCVYMIEKYGDNYEAMARDKTNYYQESVGQIRQKIKKFKSIPLNWNSYLKAKETITS